MNKYSDDKSVAPSGDAVTSSVAETEAGERLGEAPKNDFPKIEVMRVALAKDELPSIEAARFAAESPKLIDPKTAVNEPKAAPLPRAAAAPALASRTASARSSRFAFLVPSIAVAAAIGAMSGALGASGLLWSTGATALAEASPMPTIIDETRAVQDTLAQLRTELAALKTSVERARTEPNTKIAKAIESLERLEKRVNTLTAREATGSVTQPQSANAAARPQPTTIVEGWVVRDVYRGTAMIEGWGFGLIEVERGDTIPGVGRIDAIRRQDGRWVVVTSRGLITSPR